MRAVVLAVAVMVAAGACASAEDQSREDRDAEYVAEIKAKTDLAEDITDTDRQIVKLGRNVCDQLVYKSFDEFTADVVWAAVEAGISADDESFVNDFVAITDLSIETYCPQRRRSVKAEVGELLTED